MHNLPTRIQFETENQNKTQNLNYFRQNDTKKVIYKLLRTGLQPLTGSTESNNNSKTQNKDTLRLYLGELPF